MLGTIKTIAMTGSKYPPILFNTVMVQSILDDRKDQTRRTQGLEEVNKKPDDYILDGIQLNDLFIFHSKSTSEEIFIKPKCTIGDILWVRETWSPGPFENCTHIPFIYRADYSTDLASKTKWRPSLFMPREAARIFLKVTNVRCERISEISCEDCRKEGVLYHKHDNKDVDDFLALEAFMELWQKINGNDSWKQNPYVWVYDFEQVEKPADFLS